MRPGAARVLVADASASMRGVIRGVLLDVGFQHVDEATDGLTAFERFCAGAYDVVVTDWYMPRGNGLQLLRAIRHGVERSDTPVLVLTGGVSATHASEALEAGANGFVKKPIISPALSEAMLRIVAALPLVPRGQS